MIEYRVSYENPLSGYLQIEMTLAVPADALMPLELQLPAWRPGRYALQNFAQKLRRGEGGKARAGAGAVAAGAAAARLAAGPLRAAELCPEAAARGSSECRYRRPPALPQAH